MRRSRNPNASKSHWRAPSGKEYPIVDADPNVEVVIQPTKEDVEKGIPLNPNECAWACGWKRSADVDDAQIGHDKAYLVMRVEGREVAMRFKLHADARRKIDHFDATGEMLADMITLHGIPPSERMDSQRSQQKRSRERWQTLGKAKTKKRLPLNVRNASRRAQVVRDAE